MKEPIENSPAPFEDMGHIELDFLGRHMIIGCVKGEEAKALRLAKRFEVDVGEVIKSVSATIDLIPALIMAGVLAYEQIEQSDPDF